MAEPPEKHPLVDVGDDGRPNYVYLVGLFGGASDTEGNTRWRLYLSPRLDSYAEFDAADVVGEPTQVQANSLVPGFDATHVRLKRGAKVDFHYSRHETVTAHDQFDLDARVQGPKLTPLADSDRTMTFTTPICTTLTTLR
jgi:hypothetical protein